MKTQPLSTVSAACAVFALAAALSHASGRAQSQSYQETQDILSRYYSDGADVTSVPAAGQPGAEFFSQGADVMSVPAAGQAGAEFFSQGADVTTVPAAGQRSNHGFWSLAQTMTPAVPIGTTPSGAPPPSNVEQPLPAALPRLSQIVDNPRAVSDLAPSTESATSAQQPGDAVPNVAVSPGKFDSSSTGALENPAIDDAEDETADEPAHDDASAAAKSHPSRNSFSSAVRNFVLGARIVLITIALLVGSLVVLVGLQARERRRRRG